VTVTLSPFAIGKFPVTNAQYRSFLEAPDGGRRPGFWLKRVGGSGDSMKPQYWDDPKYNQPDQPVVGVSWHQAAAFCAWAGLALPAEAQWEYACRAGTPTAFWSGDAEEDLARVGWYLGNAGERKVEVWTHDLEQWKKLIAELKPRLHPVGALPANPWGLRDVHGGVWEWCRDWYAPYPPGPQVDPEGPPSGDRRVIRGGSYGDVARGARSAFRYGWSPGVRNVDLGFRPVLPAPQPGVGG
jgi:formylglycine-generating enzyme required for sulfatase activity